MILLVLLLTVVLAVVLLLAGFEMFLVLGVPALAAKEIFYGTMPDPAVVQKIFGGIDHATLLAIPFFIFAAHLMGSGQIARNLTALVRTLEGHARGGMGRTVIGGSMAFGSVSGPAPRRQSRRWGGWSARRCARPASPNASASGRWWRVPRPRF